MTWIYIHNSVKRKILLLAIYSLLFISWSLLLLILFYRGGVVLSIGSAYMLATPWNRQLHHTRIVPLSSLSLLPSLLSAQRSCSTQISLADSKPHNGKVGHLPPPRFGPGWALPLGKVGSGVDGRKSASDLDWRGRLKPGKPPPLAPRSHSCCTSEVYHEVPL